MSERKLISIVAGCYNEEENIAELYERILAVMAKWPHCDFEILLIDNASTDNTVGEIRKIASHDKRLKAIVNARNFGHIRSPYHAFLLAQGDAVIGMASDLEDPPEMIDELLRAWEAGFKIAVGVRRSTEERGFMPIMRRSYYRLIAAVSETEKIANFTGFGLYDRQVMDILREMKDPYPYFRGLVAEIGFKRAEIPFDKPLR